MHLVKTEGKVQVNNAEGKSVKVAENLGLYSGYEVSTLAESYGWITLDKTKLAKMDETLKRLIDFYAKAHKGV